MSGHKHADLMLEYAKDAFTNKTPWELWEVKMYDKWESVTGNFNWYEGYEYRRKPVKWQPVGGSCNINSGGKISNLPSWVGTKEFGHERPTREQAEKASVEMRKFNRLLALRDELCGDDVVDWSDVSSFKYTIEFIVDDDRWSIDVTRIYQKIAVYFTTKSDAERACGMLNSGEVEL